MQLAGGCGSGTLVYFRRRQHKNVCITLIFFIVGSLVGTYNFTFWLDLPSLGNISLLEKFGIIKAIIIQLIFISFLYMWCSFIDKKRNSMFLIIMIFLNQIVLT